MRSSKNRSRSKSNRQRSIGNIINRVFDSSGPEGKVRGTPQQIIEKYLMLARDAQLGNDRVAEQNFLQHAEHYTRMLGEAQAELAREQAARQAMHGQGQPWQQGGPQGQGGGNGNGNGGNGGGDNRGWQGRDRYDTRQDDRDEVRPGDAEADTTDDAHPYAEPEVVPDELPAFLRAPVYAADEGPAIVETPEDRNRPDEGERRPGRDRFGRRDRGERPPRGERVEAAATQPQAVGAAEPRAAARQRRPRRSDAGPDAPDEG
jgi:hypothetical protein